MRAPAALLCSPPPHGQTLQALKHPQLPWFRQLLHPYLLHNSRNQPAQRIAPTDLQSPVMTYQRLSYSVYRGVGDLLRLLANKKRFLYNSKSEGTQNIQYKGGSYTWGPYGSGYIQDHNQSTVSSPNLMPTA